jgi:hypothetical protein
MPAYDSNGFNPPAPIAIVSLRNPANGRMKSGVRMLLDTGADVTLLPMTMSVAQELGIIQTAEKRYELEGFEGQVYSSVAVRAEGLSRPDVSWAIPSH